MGKTKLMVCFLWFGIIYNISAQSKSPQFIPSNAYAVQNHTYAELKDLAKGELINLYIERVKKVVTVLPFVGISNKSGIGLKELGYPENSDNISAVNKQIKGRDAYGKALDESLKAMLPYTDKENLIWSVLFYEELMRKIELGKDF